ncbi:MAG TPA: tetratricopeptide repeat protein [Myxococcales bacterium]|nr:tetratricopeptide repeat protein [Myxococcales bacterium]
MRAACLVVLWIASTCACLPRAAPSTSGWAPESLGLGRPAQGEHPPLMGPAEVVRALEDSPVPYNLAPLQRMDPPALEQYASELWPRSFEEIPFPAVRVESGGERRLEKYRVNAEADRLIAQAEPHFSQRRFEEAAALYRRALKLQPDYYPALLDLGDVAALSGDPQGALQHYERAIQVNPVDHRGHFLRGNALLDLGRVAPALDAYATALALRPRNPVMLDAIEARQQKLGVRLVRDFFLPRGVIRPAARGVDVLFDATRPHWVAWAACKGLWVGEARHRQEMTGAEEHRFTPVEEAECIGALLEAYLHERASGDAEEEPELERLGRIAAEGELPELILYDLASRRSPHALLLLDDARRAKVERFVRHNAFEKQGPGVGPTYEVQRAR